MRTIVRPNAGMLLESTDTMRGPVPTFAGPSVAADTGTTPRPDGYTAKLAKYVPAEVIAFYAPAYALMGGTRGGAILTLSIGILGTFVYLEWQAHREHQPQPWSFYVLAVLAFMGWSLGTSSVGADLLGMSAEMGAFVMLAAILLIPAIDGLAVHETAPSPVPSS